MVQTVVWQAHGDGHQGAGPLDPLAGDHVDHLDHAVAEGFHEVTWQDFHAQAHQPPFDVPLFQGVLGPIAYA